jgi:hypothetical protein
LLKIAVLLRLAWAMQRSEALEVFRIAPLAQTQTERLGFFYLLIYKPIMENSRIELIDASAKFRKI